MHVSTLFFPFASLLLVTSLAAPTAQAEDLAGVEQATSGAGEGNFTTPASSDPATPPKGPVTARRLDIIGQGLDPVCWDALLVNTYLGSNVPDNCPEESTWAQCFVNQRVSGANYNFMRLPPAGTYHPPPELPISPPDDVQVVYGDWSIWFLHRYLSRIADEIRSGTIPPSEGQTIVDAKTLSSVLDCAQAPGAADPQLRRLGINVAFFISALDVVPGAETDGLAFLQKVLDDAVSGPFSGAFERLSARGGLIHSPL